MRDKCEVCAEPATRRNNEYEGCVPYPLCEKCYKRKCGIPNLDPDFLDVRPAVLCCQCGKVAFKKDPINGHPYCRPHFEDRVDGSPAYYE